MSTRNKKWSVISLVLIGVFLMTAGVYAQCGMWKSNRGWSGHEFSEKYRLTEAQQQTIDEIHTKYDDKIQPLQNDLHSKRLELRAYASRADAAAGKIKAFGKEIRNIEGKIDDLRVDAQAEAAKVLTKEQREYFGDSYNFWGMGSGWHADCPMMHDNSGWNKHGRSGMSQMRDCNLRHSWRW